MIGVWQLSAMNNYFPEAYRVRYEVENGEMNLRGDLRQISLSFFFTRANQLDSYYHLVLLMSLVRETKPPITPQQTTAAQGWGGLGGGAAKHRQMHFKVF